MISPRSIFVLILLLTVWTAPSAQAQLTPDGGGFFLKARAGFSDYLGDNNTAAFNTAALGVPGKVPYSFGFEVGYQLTDRWSTGFGVQHANYPIITRFYHHLNVADHPTERRTYQLLVRYRMGAHQLRPFTHMGYHLTFGDVNIFEKERLAKGEILNTQRHYMHGPFLGLGMEYVVSPRLSLFLEATAHVTLMDDSVDGRLPLGPPQPTNLREANRFGTFDLLNAFGVGLLYRPLCGSACARTLFPDPRSARRPPPGHRMLRVTKMVGDKIATLSYHYALPGVRSVLVGLQAGLMPRSIYVRYAFADGQHSLDNTYFNGSFLGLSSRWFPLRGRQARLQPHVGFTASIPVQAHLVGGVDYRLGSALTVGVEGRFIHCPPKQQEIHNGVRFQGRGERVVYHMNRACEAQRGVGVAIGYKL